ncbi:MAG: hypothetical protein LAO79_02225 [Acidobacteriia bacterium]|nr:hypothetical protein [Terriglobia bacterium]
MNQDQFLALGAAAFGIIVGFIIRFFLERFDKYDLKALGGLLAIPIGTTILAFVAKFGAYGLPSYTVGLVLGLVLYQAFYAKFPSLPMRVKRRSPITIVEAENLLTLRDAAGHDAHWVRKQKMKFNEEGNRALITQLAGDGSFQIKSLTSTGRVVKPDVLSQGGVTYVYAEFNQVVKKREVVSIELTIDWTNAFTTANEAIEHKVLMETERISFTVEFPPARRSTASDMSRSFGAFTDALPDPVVSGNSVSGAIDAKIGIAETYRLSWNW